MDVGLYGILIGERRWLSSNGWGGHSNGEGSDITFSSAGVAARDGIQLGMLDEEAAKSFETCRDHRGWSPELTWGQVAVGSFACIRTPGGRRGLMRIDEMPDMEAKRPVVQVTGVTWQPVVDE
jgi:hypothetical protein